MEMLFQSKSKMSLANASAWWQNLTKPGHGGGEVRLNHSAAIKPTLHFTQFKLSGRILNFNVLDVEFDWGPVLNHGTRRRGRPQPGPGWRDWGWLEPWPMGRSRHRRLAAPLRRRLRLEVSKWRLIAVFYINSVQLDAPAASWESGGRRRRCWRETGRSWPGGTGPPPPSAAGCRPLAEPQAGCCVILRIQNLP